MPDQTYDLASVKLPRFAGFALRLFVGLLESPLTRWLLIGPLLKQGGITRLRELKVEEPPTYLPVHPSNAPQSRQPATLADLAERPAPKPAAGSFSFASIADYAAAYKQKTTSPLEVAERVITAIAASNAATPALRAIIASDAEDIRRQAQVSARLVQAGSPRSLLEGVPVAVKDEMDALPYPTRVGTAFLGQAPAAADAGTVARLRAAGALIIGKSQHARDWHRRDRAESPQRHAPQPVCPRPLHRRLLQRTGRRGGCRPVPGRARRRRRRVHPHPELLLRTGRAQAHLRARQPVRRRPADLEQRCLRPAGRQRYGCRHPIRRHGRSRPTRPGHASLSPP